MIKHRLYGRFGIACAALYLGQLVTPALAADAVPLVSPTGITLQSLLNKETRYSTIKSLYIRGVTNVVYFADDQGLALYISDKDDKAGSSNCVADCAKAWPPAVPMHGAKPSGDWSIIKRPDGSRQWAVKGKPVYRFVKDTEIGIARGDGAGHKSWHLATFKPQDALTGPSGMTLAEAFDTHAVVLVEGTQKTLYQYVGHLKNIADTCAAPDCAVQFRPVLAPSLGQSAWLDFSIVTRADGVSQWAYQGKLLFTFDGDLYPGAVQGEHANARWRPVVKSRYFMPPGVTLTMSLNEGPIWTTSAGMTLYRQEALIHRQDHTSLRTETGNPPYGRSIAARGCINDCLKSYRPLQAPQNAVPTGYWSIYVRDDGTRQWAYKGYALYTYVEDKAPKQTESIDKFIYLVDDGKGTNEIPAVTQQTVAPALCWRYAEP